MIGHRWQLILHAVAHCHIGTDVNSFEHSVLKFVCQQAISQVDLLDVVLASHYYVRVTQSSREYQERR